jgi:hypothetical protein
MLEALPLDEQRDLEAQIEISFWGRALGNAALRDLQHSEFDDLMARLRGHLREAARLGQLGDGVDIGLAAHQLVVLIDGLSAERVLYPDRVSPARQRKMLSELLANFARPPCAPIADSAQFGPGPQGPPLR